jgi:hypothetical protein
VPRSFLETFFFSLIFTGSLRVLNATTGNCALSDRSLCEDSESEDDDVKPIVTSAFYCQALDKIVVVTVDHNILFLNRDFTFHKQVKQAV